MTHEPKSASCKNRPTRDATWREILRDVGERYAECRLSTFDVCDNNDEMHKRKVAARERCTDWALHLGENIAAGRGVVLFGPPGTGKDHLAVGLLYRCVAANYWAHWVDGTALFSRMRELMGAKGPSERQVVAGLVGFDVLAISDIVPSVGAVTPYQAGVLFQVIDARYRQRKPTIVTANVASGREAEDRLTPAIVDRLRDGATGVWCDWPSYRGPVS